MKLLEILLISISLAMDAFSVSIYKGLKLENNLKRNAFIIALFFSIFQMLMPIIGFYLGNSLNSYLFKFNYLLAFFLLIFIGFNIIKESFEEPKLENNLDLKELIILSLITSIDAFSIGLTFSLLKVNLLTSIIIIGIVTFILSLIGVFIGKIIKNKYQKLASIIGGIILIIIGLKILIEHLINY